MRTINSIRFAFLILGVVAMSCSESASSIETPSAEFLSAALKRQLQSGPVEVNYVYTNEGRPEKTRRCLYVRTSVKQYLESRIPDGTLSIQLFDAVQNSGRFLTISGNEKHAAIANRAERDERGYARLPDPLLFNFPNGTLCDLIGTGKVSTTTSMVDGHSCWRVEISPDSTRPYPQYIVLVDPEIGFCPRLIESYFAKDFSLIALLSEYTDIGSGVWYPRRMQIKPTYEGVLASSRDVAVESVKFADEQQVNSLRVDFPSGTIVRDLILDAEYTAP